MIYIFTCGHASKKPDKIRTRKAVVRYACPQCGTAVEQIEINCAICGRIYRVGPTGGKSKKCPEHRELLTVQEAAQATGIATATLYNYYSTGRCKGTKIGGKLCFSKGQICTIKRNVRPQMKNQTPCDRYNCYHRTACLGTPQFYQPCSKYKMEYEADDFCSVKADLFDRAGVSEGV